MTSKRDSQALAQATRLTAADLRSVATTVRLRQLSKLSLPEIEHLSDEIARVVPAGNAPAMILSGLANIRSRTVDVTESRRHIGLLFRGLRHTLDEAVYATFFAGPAAVLYSYQLLLQLAGRAGPRQVKGARLGLAQNMGGSGGSSTVHILEVS